MFEMDNKPDFSVKSKRYLGCSRFFLFAHYTLLKVIEFSPFKLLYKSPKFYTDRTILHKAF